MKSMTWVIATMGILITFEIKGQEDPLQNFKGVFESSLTAGIRRGPANEDKAVFNTPGGDFQFERDAFMPDFAADAFFGYLFKNNEGKPSMILKTGFGLYLPHMRLRDEQNNKLTYAALNARIPFGIIFREPIEHRTVKDGYFRAVEWGFIPYISSQITETIYPRDDFLTDDNTVQDYNFGRYLGFGAMFEVGISSLNSEGRGHKYGIRIGADLSRMIIFSETPSQLYPASLSIGIFYNIRNDYFGEAE